MAAALPLSRIVRHLDEVLRTREFPDYPGALNGLQLESDRDVDRVAVGVDASRAVIEGAIAQGARLLIVHHGLFWGGTQRIVGPVRARLKPAFDAELAIYGAHLPLDAHPELGNNPLLARALGLEPSDGFGRYQTATIGVSGTCDLPTGDLVARARALAQREGGDVVVAGLVAGKQTRRWALITGAGASSDALREAAALGVDTFITGEGPHHTAIEGPELGI
ncbi:MAG: Nif3-like dinuclear metal center hexameric protein, partial [Gemmatimonadetes bacterium]|nr:Nif3-like dinuclear metal center hexameric protein [Gemmatimonadota bacterium]